MASVVDTAGEIKQTGQRLFTAHMALFQCVIMGKALSLLKALATISYPLETRFSALTLLVGGLCSLYKSTLK